MVDYGQALIEAAKWKASQRNPDGWDYFGAGLQSGIDTSFKSAMEDKRKRAEDRVKYVVDALSKYTPYKMIDGQKVPLNTQEQMGLVESIRTKGVEGMSPEIQWEQKGKVYTYGETGIADTGMRTDADKFLNITNKKQSIEDFIARRKVLEEERKREKSAGRGTSDKIVLDMYRLVSSLNQTLKDEYLPADEREIYTIERDNAVDALRQLNSERSGKSMPGYEMTEQMVEPTGVVPNIQRAASKVVPGIPQPSPVKKRMPTAVTSGQRPANDDAALQAQATELLKRNGKQVTAETINAVILKLKGVRK